MMDGQPVNQQNQRGAGDASSATTRSTVFTDSTVSPLQIFVQAKKNINDIFLDIEEYIGETSQFIDG